MEKKRLEDVDRHLHGVLRSIFFLNQEGGVTRWVLTIDFSSHLPCNEHILLTHQSLNKKIRLEIGLDCPSIEVNL